MRNLLTLFVCSTLLSCAGEVEDSAVSAIDPNFFNLKEFVAQEKGRMIDMSISKTVTVNGIEETQELTEVDWELELAPFAQSNIDRPAMWDGYQVDKSRCEGMTKLEYTSIDPSSYTKSLEVTFSDKSNPLDTVHAILINNGFNSYIAKTSQRLIWWEGGYEINSIQKAILSDQRYLSIGVKWKSGELGPCVFDSEKNPNLMFLD